MFFKTLWKHKDEDSQYDYVKQKFNDKGAPVNYFNVKVAAADGSSSQDLASESEIEMKCIVFYTCHFYIVIKIYI